MHEIPDPAIIVPDDAVEEAPVVEEPVEEEVEPIGLEPTKKVKLTLRGGYAGSSMFDWAESYAQLWFPEQLDVGMKLRVKQVEFAFRDDTPRRLDHSVYLRAYGQYGYTLLPDVAVDLQPHFKRGIWYPGQCLVLRNLTWRVAFNDMKEAKDWLSR